MRRSELTPVWITAVSGAVVAMVTALMFFFGSGIWSASMRETNPKSLVTNIVGLDEPASRLSHLLAHPDILPRILTVRANQPVDLSPVPLQFLCTFDERLGELIGTLWITPDAEQPVSRLLHDATPTKVVVAGFEYIVQVLDADYAGRSVRISVSRKSADQGEAK
jgi:hypothetical protein